MKTFLAQNQFGSPVPGADDAAASSSPLLYDAAAALSVSFVSMDLITEHAETEAAVSVRTAAASDLDQLANYFRRHESRFVPDRVAMWDAMHDETAPRVRAGDPVWADEPPLFLQAIGS